MALDVEGSSEGTMTITWFDHYLRDCRSALRSMTKCPVACAVAVISLAAGIGCTTATLTIRNAFFYSAPPLYQHPEQLSFLGVSTPDRPGWQGLSADLYRSWTEETQLQSGIAASTPFRTKNVRTPESEEAVSMSGVTPELFSVLGVTPFLGRTFSSAEVEADKSSIAVLNYPVWQRLFRGSPDVLGTAVWIEDRPHSVVGVMPERFWFSDMGAPIWTPLDVNTLGSDERLEVVVRRRADVTPLVVSAFTFQSVIEQIGSEISVAIYPMTPLIATGILLTSAGIYGVLSFAITRRSKELAIRMAVGATGKHLLRLVAGLGLRLVATGIALGIAATFGLTRLVQGVSGVFASPSWPVFVMPVGVVLAIAVLATCVPSRRAVMIDPAVLLRTE